jgi:hypothetical protein
MEERYFGAHLLSDAGSGVQGNGFPGSLYCSSGMLCALRN